MTMRRETVRTRLERTIDWLVSIPTTTEHGYDTSWKSIVSLVHEEKDYEVTVTVNVAIVAKDQHIVHFVTTNKTHSNDQLTAMVSAIVAGTKVAYIINVFDGSMCVTRLKGDKDVFLRHCLGMKLFKEPLLTDMAFHTLFDISPL